MFFLFYFFISWESQLERVMSWKYNKAPNETRPMGQRKRDEIDQSHKSHNAPVPFPTMHQSEQKLDRMPSLGQAASWGRQSGGDPAERKGLLHRLNRNVHISVLNGALWDMGQVHCGICADCPNQDLELIWLNTDGLVQDCDTRVLH